MSFGVVQSAISSIKSNRSLLSKRDRLKNTLSGSDKSKKLELKCNKFSHYELIKLRDKLQQEYKQIRIKQYIVLGILMLVLVSIFIYFF
ncbi:hypothetical protein SAMN05428642_103291 [Flaviramulus basaltis]|uniref:Uncharacterized protein n=1 Tax=Flaviramulus basaltis TaxID=369401 RepID=A0A1K2IN78_9FLAO|nr:hypothetical protein SAMN05428642_103291 [Flaviramulus basaltis]